MQKTIYIKSPELWDEIKSMTNGRSISGYLVQLHRDHVARVDAIRSRSEQITADIAVVDSLPDRIFE